MTRLTVMLAIGGAMLGGLVLAAGAGEPAPHSGGLDKLPVNQWVTLFDGPSELAARHARFVWLAGLNRGLVWPAHNPRSAAYNLDRHRQLHLFDPVSRAWDVQPSTFPEGGEAGHGEVGKSCVYLPGLRKVLFLLPYSQYGSRTVRANSWLLDTANASWQGVAVDLRMSDRSADFNPVATMDGLAVPAWGTLCYDAHNKEALLAGGGQVWGRVAADREKVAVGDWIYDETSQPKRTRRLVAADAGRITEARRWFPGHCGSWTFSEATGQWTSLAQPLSAQPSGRLLPAMAYDAEQSKIVLFGGDDLARCLDDTWVYDCPKRTWQQVKPAVAPPARAGAAMVYLPDQKAVLLVGGYATGWQALKDCWVYRTAENQWTRLELDLPGAAFYASADVDEASRAVLLNTTPHAKGGNLAVHAMRPDLPTAKIAAPPEPGLKYHCLAPLERQPSPDEWIAATNKPTDPAVGRQQLADLPANAWVLREPPLKTKERRWGSYCYDARNHKAYTWGGGHGGYMGADVSEYDVLTNHWIGMVDPPDYKPPWRHKNSGDSPPGLTFRGCILMQSHARKSYAIDPRSDLLITSHGDLYSPADRMFVGSVGRCPGKWGMSDQVAYVTTPHGLYGYNRDGLYRADVSAGKWETVCAAGGPPNHNEVSHMCYDSRRDQIVYFCFSPPDVWMFDLKTAKWEQRKAEGKLPVAAMGDSAYLPELDAVLMVFAPQKNQPEQLFFYKLDHGTWHTAPYVGDKPPRGVVNTVGRDCSTFYDPQFKLAVRLVHVMGGSVEVLVMRLDPAGLKLDPLP